MLPPDGGLPFMVGRHGRFHIVRGPASRAVYHTLVYVGPKRNVVYFSNLMLRRLKSSRCVELLGGEKELLSSIAGPSVKSFAIAMLVKKILLHPTPFQL